MLKKLVSLVVSVSCVLAATGVSAATYTGTVSEYVNKKIEVTSYVTAEKGDIITYLAYDEGVIDLETGLDADTIVYIDQKTATSDNQEIQFKYTTNAANAGANVKVGGKVKTPFETNTDSIDPSQVVEVDLGDGVYEEFEITSEPGLGKMVSFNVPKLENKRVTEVYLVLPDDEGGEWLKEVNFYQGSDATKIYMEYSGEIYAEASFKIKVTTAELTADPTIGIIEAGRVADETGAVVAVGKVTGNAVDQGILFATTPDDVAAHNGTYENEGNAFPALGYGTDGLFAVKLTEVKEFPAFAAAEKLYARAYVKVGEGYVYSDYVYEIDLTQDGGAVNE